MRRSSISLARRSHDPELYFFCSVLLLLNRSLGPQWYNPVAGWRQTATGSWNFLIDWLDHGCSFPFFWCIKQGALCDCAEGRNSGHSPDCRSTHILGNKISARATSSSTVVNSKYPMLWHSWSNQQSLRTNVKNALLSYYIAQHQLHQDSSPATRLNSRFSMLLI